MTWSELFPEGRDIYYEGVNPQQFVREIAAEFRFDPSADPNWGSAIDFTALLNILTKSTAVACPQRPFAVPIDARRVECVASELE